MIERVEFFGDSIVRGALWADGKFRLRPGNGFPALGAMGLAVRNNAMIGASIVKGASVVKRRLPALDERTLVILGFGGNDCNFDWQAVSEDPDGAHLPAVLLQTFRERYAKVIARVQATGAQVALMSLVPLDADKFFAHIGEGRDADAILRWLGDKAILYRWHENYNRTVERLAAATGCTLVDLRDGFLTRHDFDGLIGPDGIHPTEAGYAIIDDIVAGDVEDLIALPALA